MNYWDSSAIVALIADETLAAVARQVLDADDRIAAWWGTSVECVAAIARKEREGGIGVERAAELLHRLDTLATQWYEVHPGRRVKTIARRLLRVHPLKAADALQLAAAIAVAEDEPGSIGFVSLDGRLNEAAGREGFALRVSGGASAG